MQTNALRYGIRKNPVAANTRNPKPTTVIKGRLAARPVIGECAFICSATDQRRTSEVVATLSCDNKIYLETQNTRYWVCP